MATKHDIPKGDISIEHVLDPDNVSGTLRDFSMPMHLGTEILAKEFVHFRRTDFEHLGCSIQTGPPTGDESRPVKASVQGS
jgi:hypothetical protein